MIECFECGFTVVSSLLLTIDLSSALPQQPLRIIYYSGAKFTRAKSLNFIVRRIIVRESENFTDFIDWCFLTFKSILNRHVNPLFTLIFSKSLGLKRSLV